MQSEYFNGFGELNKNMKHSIYTSFFTAGFILLLLVSFSCATDKIVFEEEHHPELNNKSIISGYVLEKETKTELIGAKILLNDGEYETRSTVKGFFTLKDLSPGAYKITIEYPGYKTFSKPGFRVKGNYVYDLNIELEADLYLPEI